MGTRNRPGIGLSYTGPPGYAFGFNSLESIPGLHKRSKIRAQEQNQILNQWERSSLCCFMYRDTSTVDKGVHRVSLYPLCHTWTKSSGIFNLTQPLPPPVCFQRSSPDYTHCHTDNFGKLWLSEKSSLHKAQLVFTITPIFNKSSRGLKN